MYGCCIVGCPFYGRMGPVAETTFHVFPNPDREPYRHRQWRNACRGNPRLKDKTGSQVFKMYRVCRRHFDEESRNGGCRRLNSTAVPTLHLWTDSDPTDEPEVPIDGRIDLEEPEPDEQISDADEYVESISIEVSPQTAQHRQKEVRMTSSPQYGELLAVQRTNASTKRNASHNSAADDDEPKCTPRQKRIRLRDDEAAEAVATAQEHKIDAEQALDVEWVDYSCEEATDTVELELWYGFDDSMSFVAPITDLQVQQWHQKFYACPKNRLAQNVCSRVDPFEACISRPAIESTQHVFAHRIDAEVKPVTNQKNSGRCWLFAALNCIRIPFAKHHNLEEFEFSQSYLFYWDKIERCHYFLSNIIETARRGEPVDGRLVAFLLSDPTCDGGQWDMLANLIKKYGLMPKKYFPDSFCSETSVRMNAVLKSKLREYAKVLREQIAAGDDEAAVRRTLDGQMQEIYTVVGICLGIPRADFTWEFVDKAKKYHAIDGPVTPLQFYEKHVRPIYNVDEKVVLMTDPRPFNAYNEMYTVDCLGNVVGGRPVLYNNQPVEVLMDLVAASIKKNEPVWFGCEVSKRFAPKQGIEDPAIHDFHLMFGVDIQTTMSKADRLIHGESAMTHAMVFTGVTCDDKGKPVKFRVENSWGEDRGEKGYLVMSADWFREFVFEAVIDRSYVPADVLQVMSKEPIVLPAWDPMGTLAK